MQLYNDFPLDQVLWYKIGGKARTFIQANDYDGVRKAIEHIASTHYNKVFICGLGSNLIFTDDYFDGVVLQIANTDTAELRMLPGGQMKAFAGTVLDSVITASLDYNLLGLEWAGGLPGTVGAGVRGNVGAFGGEIKDSFFEAEVVFDLGKTNQIKTLSNDDLNFAYRHSLLKEVKDAIVLSATFQLSEANAAAARAKEVYEENKQYRVSHHPLEYPNCGSVFKNIKGEENVNKVLSVWPDVSKEVKAKWHGKVAMGYIVKRLGLSGRRVGNAQVSEKHANFIVNLGGAKAKDVLTIIHEIQSKFTEKFGFAPEVEVEIVE